MQDQNQSPPDIDVSAANQALFDSDSSDQTNSPPTTTSASHLSLSPLSFSTNPSPHQSNHLQPSSSLSPNGIVAAASPSFQSTHFPPHPLQQSHSADGTDHSLRDDFVEDDTLEQALSSSSTLTPVASAASSPDEKRGEILGVGRRSTRRKRDRSYVEEEDDEMDHEKDQEDLIETKIMMVPPKIQTTSFIYKLYEILEDPNNISLISYGHVPGSFEVHDIVSLSRDVLPKYFKHSNFASFSRQLNMWGWKKESRHGGWIFLHPVFRAGRYDLLAHIKRSDEAGKKRPETVASRRRKRTVTEQPLEAPTAPKQQGQGQRYLSLDTSLPTSSSAPPFPNFPQPHPHSAPASVSLTQQSRTLHERAHLETQFATSRPLHSPALISPLFNPDGSHSRPISPPSFASAPRPYLLPPPIFRGPQAEERRLSFESSLHSNQLAETKKRLEMVTSLLDHVLERLGVDENHEKFRSFPFYVFDPRFHDPTAPMQTIIADYDARRVFNSGPRPPPQFQPAPYSGPSSSFYPPLPNHLQESTNSPSAYPGPSRPLPHFPSALDQALSASDNVPIISPMNETSYSARDRSSFDSTLTAISPEDQGPGPRRLSPEDHYTRRRMHTTDGRFQYERSNQAGDRPSSSRGVMNRPPFPHHALSSSQLRPSTAPSSHNSTPTTLGPSSFSLVDFSNDNPPSRGASSSYPGTSSTRTAPSDSPPLSMSL